MEEQITPESSAPQADPLRALVENWTQRAIGYRRDARQADDEHHFAVAAQNRVGGDAAELCALQLGDVLDGLRDAAVVSEEIAPPVIAVTTDGGTHWLQCFADDIDAEHGQIVTEVQPGTSWIEMAAAVAAHQREHGCTIRKQEPGTSLREQVAELASDWAAPADRPATMTRDEIVEQYIYQECAKSLRSLLSGDDAPAGASGDGQMVPAPASQVRRFAVEDGNHA